MKKLYFLFALSLYSIIGLSQAPRYAIYEHFTQASCGPCAAQNPGFKSFLSGNVSQTTAIKYQVSWPGYDPMHLHNPADVNARRNYYSVSAVPNVVFEGNQFSGSPASASNQTMLNNRVAVNSPFEMRVSKTFSHDTVFVQLIVKKVSAASNNFLRIFSVVVENEIQWESAPGSNGETAFDNVMKKILPNNSGTPLNITLAVGDSIVLNDFWKMTNVFNKNNIEIISFIQRVGATSGDKEMVQGASTFRTTHHSVDASLTRIVTSVDPSCSNSITPKLRIRNMGNNSLTSAVIKYQMNGGTINTHNWNGNLARFGGFNITLPIVPATSGNNTFVAWVENVNGANSDVNSINDTMVFSFTYNPVTPVSYNVPTNTFTFELATDRYGSETTWQVKNSSGQILYSGGPYQNLASNGILVQPTQTWILPQNECVEFIINDAYGDGICCAYGAGYYRIKHGTTILVSGGSFTNKDKKFMEFPSTVTGIKEAGSIENDITVFPNPFVGNSQIKLTLKGQTSVSFKVYNLIGEEVLQSALGNQSAGEHTYELNLAGKSPGIYFVKLTIGESTVTKKVILSK